jgi:hypothetical protein
MNASCCNQPTDTHRGNEGYRRVLWAVLSINAAMFAVEVAAGLAAGSASLQADALDFLGDTGNYAISNKHGGVQNGGCSFDTGKNLVDVDCNGKSGCVVTVMSSRVSHSNKRPTSGGTTAR